MATTATLSLDELVAINDELAALVRAGVPLEATLGEMGRDMPGRLGRATTELAERIERGASLSQALAAMPGVFPPIYQTAVEAGVRAGRLPVVLEDLASSARRLSELRRVVSMAALYPFLVLLLAYGLFVLFIAQVVPNLVTAFEGHETFLLRALMAIGRTAHIWAPIVPILLLLLAVLWWYQMSRGRAALGWLPIAGRMLRDARVASFSEILALLVDHDVPLGQAVTLAADASGDPRMAASAHKIAAEIERGVHLGKSLTDSQQVGDLPPFFLWLIGTGHRKELLVPLLEQSAEMYRRRALRRSDWIRFYLPLLMTLVIGGVTVLLYALALFVPLTDLLQDAATNNLMTR